VNQMENPTNKSRSLFTMHSGRVVTLCRSANLITQMKNPTLSTTMVLMPESGSTHSVIMNTVIMNTMIMNTVIMCLRCDCVVKQTR